MTRWLIPLTALALACNPDKGEKDDDLDNDGVDASDGDCDDDNADVYPGADERCDELDNDCDEEVDEEAVDAPAWYADTDGDGFGDADTAAASCIQPSGYVDNGDDCDDNSTSINPDGTELCDDYDNDCDGSIDESPSEDDPGAADAATWYADTDSDGYGDPDQSQIACEQPSGFTDDSSDCHDDNADANPDGDDSLWGPDWVDHDCDGSLGQWAMDTYAHITITKDPGDPTFLAAVTLQGDLDSDGVADAVIGNPFADAANWFVQGAGRVYVLGSSGQLATTLASLDGVGVELSVADADLTVFNDSDSGGGIGSTVDVIAGWGSGCDGIVTGAPLTSTGGTIWGGTTYVVGCDDFDSDGLAAMSSDGGAGVALGVDIGQYRWGWSLAPAGDLLGDGGDWLVAAGFTDTEDDYGQVLAIDVDALDGSSAAYGAFTVDGFSVAGSTGSEDTPYFGSTGRDHRSGLEDNVRGAGDFTGDGLPDFVVGSGDAPYIDSTSGGGRVYVIDSSLLAAAYTSRTPSGDSSFTYEDVAFAIEGDSEGDELGLGLVAQQDFDGDGAVDLVIGAPGAYGTAGAAYVVWGPLSGYAAGEVVTIGDLVDAGQATVWVGATAGEEAGVRMTAGDMDGDGLPDLVVGAPEAGHDVDGDGETDRRAGRVYVMTNDQLGAGGQLDDARLVFTGPASSAQLGDDLDLGDVNGDGLADLIISAPGGKSDGLVYLLLGSLWPDGTYTGGEDPDTGDTGDTGATDSGTSTDTGS